MVEAKIDGERREDGDAVSALGELEGERVEVWQSRVRHLKEQLAEQPLLGTRVEGEEGEGQLDL
eukprot:1528567-Prymnesium_polylepis.1